MDMLFLFKCSWELHIQSTENRSPGGTFHLQTTPESPQGVRRFLDLVRDGFFRDQVSWAKECCWCLHRERGNGMIFLNTHEEGNNPHFFYV